MHVMNIHWGYSPNSFHSPCPFCLPALSGHSRSQHLSPEESSLGPLNDLLVDATGWVVHDDGSFLVVNLRVDPSVANEIDYPLLTLVLTKTQTCAQILNVDTCVDLAVALRDQVACRVNKGVGCGNEEEVRLEDIRSERELALGLLKVKVDVEGTNEICDGVCVLICLLLDDAYNVLHLLLMLARIPCSAATGNDRSGQISQDPGTASLDSVDKRWAEEEVEDLVTGRVVVEEREQSPVNEPRSVVKLSQGVVEQLRVDALLDLQQLLDSLLPVGVQNL